MRHAFRPTLLGLVVLVLAMSTSASGLAAGRHHASSEPSARARTSAQGPHAQAFTSIRRYRLITGQTVRVLTRADGSAVSSLIGGGEIAQFGTPTATYVVPRSSRATLLRADLSLFDVTALARADSRGRIPVVVRLARGVDARSVPGLRLDRPHARDARGGAVVHGSYGPRFAGLDAGELSRIRSIRLDAPTPARTALPSVAVPTHTVQVHVTGRSASTPAVAIVTLLNVENSQTYYSQDDSDAAGLATFDDVPEGEYAVMAFTFSRLAMNPEFTVGADQTVDLSLADATVRPHVTFPHHRALDKGVSVLRLPDTGIALPLSFSASGAPLRFRVPPLGSAVAHGSLSSGLAATFVRGPTAPAYDSIASTADTRPGIPSDLTVVHHRRDFARVIDRFHSNGPTGDLPTIISSASLQFAFLGIDEPAVKVPGRRTTLLQAGPDESYQETFFPQADARSPDDISQLSTVRSYRVPGSTHVIDWAAGPVGPGSEGRDRRFGYAQRRGDRMSLDLPLFNGAGTSMFAYVDRRDGFWSLRQGKRLLAQGRQDIYQPLVNVPSRDRRYVLAATSAPVSRSWQLSTRASDIWSFHSASGQSDLPLLMPAYVAPQDLSNTVPAGPTSYRLSFRSLARPASRIVDARVLLSTDDGHTWRPASLTRLAPRAFRVHYVSPSAHGTTRYLSIKVTGRDAGGNTVKETALRAYRLS